MTNPLGSALHCSALQCRKTVPSGGPSDAQTVLRGSALQVSLSILRTLLLGDSFSTLPFGCVSVAFNVPSWTAKIASAPARTPTKVLIIEIPASSFRHFFTCIVRSSCYTVTRCSTVFIQKLGHKKGPEFHPIVCLLQEVLSVGACLVC